MRPLPVLLFLACSLVAQDEVLVVEQARDVRARDQAARLLRSIRTELRFEGITPRELCRHFALATGDRINFLCAAKGELLTTPVDVQLGKVSLWGAMAAVQEASALRFVWRDGLVFVVGRDDVKPLAYLQIYDLRPMCAPLKNFPGPDLRLGGLGDERPLWPEEEDSGTTVSGFTAEGVEELIKQHVTPELWGTAAVSLTNNRGMLVVRHSVQGHREIQRLLRMLGLLPEPLLLRRR